MNDQRLKELLSTYAIPDALDEQIRRAQEKAKKVRIRSVPTQPFSLWAQIRVQATYLSKWFYLSCALIALLCFIFSVETDMTHLDSIFFGMSPLFLLPCIFVIYRAISDRMIEFEAACKYSMTKLFAGRFIVLGMVVSASIFVVGILLGFLQTGFTLRPLLLGFISFTLTATITLWFVKRNKKCGIVCGILSSLGTAYLAVWEVNHGFIHNVNMGIILLVFVLGWVAVSLAVYQYVKSISFEGESKTWNYALIA